MNIRIRTQFISENGEAHWDIAKYRAGFHSLIKQAIQRSNPTLYQIFFDKRKSRVKPYTFTVLFPNARLKRDSIYFSKCVFLFSSVDPEFIAGMNNLLMSLDRIEVLGTDLTIRKREVYRIPEAKESSIVVQTLAPVLVRAKDNPDHYLVPTCYDSNGRQYCDKGFPASLRENVRQQVKGIMPELEPVVDTLHLESVDCKFTVVKYEKDNVLLKFPGFRGTFRLTGDPALLHFLLAVGLGARRSQGFGMIELKRDVKGRSK